MEIIETITVTDFNILVAGIIMIVFIVVGFVVGWRFDEALIVLVGIGLGIVLGSVGGAMTAYPTGEIQYKVQVDETVSLIEFLEEYEIISQDGNILIVREKDSIESSNTEENTKKDGKLEVNTR